MNREKFTKEIKSGRPMNCALVNASIFIGQLGMSLSYIWLSKWTNSWPFLSNFQWYLQSERITSFRFYLLHIGCCPDNCSCLSTVSFRAIFKCTLYRHLQLVLSPSSYSSSLMTDTLALHSNLYQEVYVSTIHLELTFNIKINCAAHRKIYYQTVNIIKHITLHWREIRVSFSYLRI